MVRMPERATARVARMAAVAAIALAVAPGAASAATSGSFACDASALSLSALSGAAIAPVSVGVGSPTCGNAHRSLADVPGGLAGQGAALPLSVQALDAKTTVSGDRSQASAEGQVAGFAVGSAPLLDQLLVPAQQSLQTALQGVATTVNSQLSPITTLLNTLTLGKAGTPVLGVQSLVDEVNGVLRGKVSSSLLAAKVLDGKADARCVDGRPVLSGASNVAGVSVLGQALNLDQAVNDIGYLDSQHIDLRQIIKTQDLLNAIHLPNGRSLQQEIDSLGLVGALLNTVTSTLDTVVASLPTIAVPRQVLQAGVGANRQILGSDQLTQQALVVHLSLLGQTLLDVVAGQARIANGSVTCAPNTSVERAAVSSVAASALQCTGRPVTLIDVLQRGRRTFIQGAARSSFAGRPVNVYLAATGRKVATTKVGPNGLFQATAPLPASRIRTTNAARYYAVVASHRSQALKFHRRLTARTVLVSGGKVRMSGTVSGPKLRSQAVIVIKRRLSCHSYATVKQVKPDAHGRFSVTLTPPKGLGAVVYRAQTRVPATRRNHRKLFGTFTLPRIVGL